MKKVFLSLLIMVFFILGMSLLYAEPSAQPKEDPFKEQTDKQSDNVKKSMPTIDKIQDKVFQVPNNMINGMNKDAPKNFVKNTSNGLYNFFIEVILLIQKNSWPISALGIIVGAAMYFLYGTRGFNEKRMGAIVMLGFFTFWTITQILPAILLIIAG